MTDEEISETTGDLAAYAEYQGEVLECKATSAELRHYSLQVFPGFAALFPPQPYLWA